MEGRTYSVSCNFEKAVISASPCKNVKITLKKFIAFAKLFMTDKFHAKQAVKLLKINKNTVTRLLKIFREAVSQHMRQHKFKIGGPGKEVEIDEAKFGRRKHHKGRLMKGQWITGGV